MRGLHGTKMIFVAWCGAKEDAECMKWMDSWTHGDEEPELPSNTYQCIQCPHFFTTRTKLLDGRIRKAIENANIPVKEEERSIGNCPWCGVVMFFPSRSCPACEKDIPVSVEDD